MAQENRWMEEAKLRITEEAEQLRKMEKFKNDALLKKAELKQTTIGKYMRSKVGRRVNKAGREPLYASFPLPIAQIIREIAADSKLHVSQMVVELCVLALPLWKEYQNDILYGTRDVFVPLRVRNIMRAAITPTPVRSQKAWSSWHAEIERTLEASKPKHSKPKDPTAAVLAGLGGS